MRWRWTVLAWLALCGCDQIFGFKSPIARDAAVTDASIDGPADASVTDASPDGPASPVTCTFDGSNGDQFDGDCGFGP